MNTNYFGGELNARNAAAARRPGRSLEAQEAAYFAQFKPSKGRLALALTLLSVILGVWVGDLAFGSMFR